MYEMFHSYMDDDLFDMVRTAKQENNKNENKYTIHI